MATQSHLTNGLPFRLHRRELQDQYRYSPRIRPLYGDGHWVRDLDIVNELGGHTGCVNALSWSKNGRLLASGSDDQHLNIHTYQPEDLDQQFALTTTVATGHEANIFSVKFMPHSGDRTVITAAGDSQVRIFDLEYNGASSAPSVAATMATQRRRRARTHTYNGVRHLSDGDTNARVYRSHGDRVKRIVTESSPNLFLTCSEDGEVRQWDLRQPSAYYPSSRSRVVDDKRPQVPPPLISYKRSMIDLNTISCSPNQPWYIALGGAHLHCFLHDRRMLGRDTLDERGARDSEGEGEATRCVRKFAPNGQQRMRKTDNGHITACKISDANPNELIVSWSGEHIYSFDITRSPDASESAANSPSTLPSSASRRAKENRDRKRKRPTRGASATSAVSHEGADRAAPRTRTEASTAEYRHTQDIALRVQYINGQSEEITVGDPGGSQQDRAEHVHAREVRSQMTDVEREADSIATKLVRVRHAMFALQAGSVPSVSDPTGHAASFTTVLGFCGSTLPSMRHRHARWQYPVRPRPFDVTFQRMLRSRRESAIRFVQASGVVARALGGKLRSASSSHPALSLVTRIEPIVHEGPDIPPREQFCYDFIKAIFLWLESGVGSLLEGFTTLNESSMDVRRPVPQNASIDAFEEHLVPYLLRLASDRPIHNVDASRFEIDANRVLFKSEREAVQAFAAAVTIPFADLSNATVVPSNDQPRDSSEEPQVQDRQEALCRWGFTIGRAVLLIAGEDVDAAPVSIAFGGTGNLDPGTAYDEAQISARHENIDANVEDPVVSSYQVLESVAEDDPASTDDLSASVQTSSESAAESSLEEATAQDASDSGRGDDADQNGDEGIEESDDDGDDDQGIIDDSDAETTDGGHDPDVLLRRERYVPAFNRRQMRDQVQSRVPCASHTRTYRGHCNVKTVKDVNFFGLDDEFVVSGSDDGNLFIWDRKTAQLVNILEGDGEVVNVMQGHPYEPMLAVSGIDHTVKIFSPDARARQAARLGHGTEAADPTEFSTIAWPARPGWVRSRRSSRSATSESASPEHTDPPDEDDDEYVAPNGLASRKRFHQEYQITSENDVSRQGGNQEAFITVEQLFDMIFRQGG